MKEVAIITPVASMADVARSVVEENGYSNVEIIGGDLNLWKGVEAGRRAIDAGAKVLVSRGGTYDLIKSELDIPVVEIKVTAFDLIESFKIAKEGGATGLVGVIGFKTVSYTHLDVYKRQGQGPWARRGAQPMSRTWASGATRPTALGYPGPSGRPCLLYTSRCV